MLTPKQKHLFDFIDRRIATTGITPSMDEMRQFIGAKHPNSARVLLLGLEARGFIRRRAGAVRCIEILRLPTDASASARKARVA